VHISTDSGDNAISWKYASAQLEKGKLDLDVHLSVLTPFSIDTALAMFSISYSNWN
jgi:hypothetical protein